MTFYRVRAFDQEGAQYIRTTSRRYPWAAESFAGALGAREKEYRTLRGAKSAARRMKIPKWVERLEVQRVIPLETFEIEVLR